MQSLVSVSFLSFSDGVIQSGLFSPRFWKLSREEVFLARHVGLKQTSLKVLAVFPVALMNLEEHPAPALPRCRASCLDFWWSGGQGGHGWPQRPQPHWGTPAPRSGAAPRGAARFRHHSFPTACIGAFVFYCCKRCSLCKFSLLSHCLNFPSLSHFSGISPLQLCGCVLCFPH